MVKGLVLILSPLLFCLPARAVSLKIIRPQAAEELTLSEGHTFVIGTVTPADSSVTCNGAKCDVSEDGAFFGFVPIRRLEKMEREGNKECDAMFHFDAHSGDERNGIDVLAYTPRSPSAAEAPEQTFDPPRTLEVLRDLWMGLEGDRLGDVFFAPKGSVLTSILGNSQTYRCKSSRGTEISVSKSELKEVKTHLALNDRLDLWEISISDQGTIKVRLPGKLKGHVGHRVWGIQAEDNHGEIELRARSQLRGNGQPIDAEHPLKDLRVCLDPGHHPDLGAVGPRGFEERESNLLIARQTAKLLEAEGAMISFSREEKPLPLRERHERMSGLKPDLVISIHNNSVGDGQDPREKHGSQTFYLYPWSKPLAESVHQAILKRMGTTDMGCIRRNLYIPRFPDCPTILIEPEYIILPDQEKKFMDADYREKLAGAIVEGIREFVVSQTRTKE